MKNVLIVLGIIFSIVGIICLAICISQEEKNQTLLIIGLMCNALSIVTQRVSSRLNK